MWIAVLLLIFSATILSHDEPPTVVLPLGKIVGHVKENQRGVKYAAYEGIPYAKPPVGQLRFADPEPPDPWLDNLTATTLSVCLQYNHYTAPGTSPVTGDEDCLHLNVYVSPIEGTKKDVIVFIHGGAFMFNSASKYGEGFLMNHDVIYVSLNYRLGPLGFLSFENEHLPGNFGLKDQLLALQWVKKNIAYFGGNPNNIMITGMSAGGASVQFHTLTPFALNENDKLFHKVIAQSGCVLNPWVLVEKSREKATNLSGLVGCTRDDFSETVECLRQVAGEDIVTTVKHFQPFLYNPISPFGVVVDSYAKNPFLPEHPYELLLQKKVLDVPVIFSNVQTEGLYPGSEFIGGNYLMQIDAEWTQLLPFILDYNNTVAEENLLKVSNTIRQFYLGSKNIDGVIIDRFIDIITDRLFLSGLDSASRLHAAAITKPVYYYQFNYRGANSKSDYFIKTKDNYGVSHGDDTIYVLSSNVDPTTTEDDRKMGEILQNIWLSFAKTGKPAITNITWESMSKNTRNPIKYLGIGSPSNIIMKSTHSMGRRSFWEGLPINENVSGKPMKDEL